MAEVNEVGRDTTGYNPAEERTLRVTITMKPQVPFHENTQAPRTARDAGRLAAELAERLGGRDVTVEVEYVYPQWSRRYEVTT